MKEDQADALPAPVQRVDSIVVERPAPYLWPLIDESLQLTNWGPPVLAVELLDPIEQVGSRRLVHASFGVPSEHVQTSTLAVRRPAGQRRGSFTAKTEQFASSRIG